MPRAFERKSSGRVIVGRLAGDPCDVTAVLQKDDLPPALRSSPAARMDRFASLFEMHAAFVARALRGLGIPERDVDDALQDVFLIAQSKLETIEPGKEKAFLLAISRRRASTLRRSFDRAARRIERAFEWGEREVAHESVERTEEEHARAMLDEVLDALSEDLRTVFVLFELEEMETTEIAGLLGIPTGTVASRLRRAREKFEVEAERMRERLAREDSR